MKAPVDTCIFLLELVQSSADMGREYKDYKREDAVQRLEALVGSMLRIKLTDGRIVEGYFQCVDGEKNFVLGQVTEIHGMEDIYSTEEPQSTRSLGSCTVPGRHVVAVSVQASDFEVAITGPAVSS